MNLEVFKIKAEQDFKTAFAIREEVFVLEQKVNAEDEYDQYEESSVHFLACLEAKPVGTARWRFTEDGVKLERFAVKKEARGKGVGQALLKIVLEDIAADSEAIKQKKYLNAQLNAIPLYTKFGFEKVGEMFEECNIQHYRMKLDQH